MDIIKDLLLILGVIILRVLGCVLIVAAFAVMAWAVFNMPNSL